MWERDFRWSWVMFPDCLLILKCRAVCRTNTQLSILFHPNRDEVSPEYPHRNNDAVKIYRDWKWKNLLQKFYLRWLQCHLCIHTWSHFSIHHSNKKVRLKYP